MSRFSRLPEYLVIGNPDNRRIALFQAALKRRDMSAAHVLAYSDMLRDANHLSRWLQAWAERKRKGHRLCVRLESPGENSEVEGQLIVRGLQLEGRQSRVQIEHGRILYPREWFAGYADLLQEVVACIDGREDVRFASHPHEILLAFNKPRCHEHLTDNNIAVPDAILGVTCYEQLVDRMRGLGWSRVFVKLATGSSASGVVAFHLTDSGVRALTSMEMMGGGQRAKFYNNLKLHVYTRPTQVATIVNFLFDAGAHVERWLPKAALGDRNFDLRLLVIAGQPMHCVVRTSRSPITNLHLGNRRGDLALLQQRMPNQAWSAVLDLARRTAAPFPQSHMLGLDILLQPGFRRPTLLEVNAFGDLLPGVLYRNLDSYEAQIKAFR